MRANKCFVSFFVECRPKIVAGYSRVNADDVELLLLLLLEFSGERHLPTVIDTTSSRVSHEKDETKLLQRGHSAAVLYTDG